MKFLEVDVDFRITNFELVNDILIFLLEKIIPKAKLRENRLLIFCIVLYTNYRHF